MKQCEHPPPMRPLTGIELKHMQALEISQIVNNYAIGIGALLAGAGGFIVFYNWNKERVIENKITNFRNLYPRQQMGGKGQQGKTFRLIRQKSKVKFYLHDYQDDCIHWIESSISLNDMGFMFGDEIEVEESELKQYKESEPFYTKGRAGS